MTKSLGSMKGFSMFRTIWSWRWEIKVFQFGQPPLVESATFIFGEKDPNRRETRKFRITSNQKMDQSLECKFKQYLLTIFVIYPLEIRLALLTQTDCTRVEWSDTVWSKNSKGAVWWMAITVAVLLGTLSSTSNLYHITDRISGIFSEWGHSFMGTEVCEDFKIALKH